MMHLPKERSDDSVKSGKISGAEALKSNQARRVARERIAHAICS
jgi:hypothetical protein